MKDYNHLLKPIEQAVVEAGSKIMEIYQQPPEADIKLDGSPVTIADKAAEAIILPVLQAIAPEITIISEENALSHNIVAPEIFFLVDPLDGTKEFLRRDGLGAFTVNVAIVKNNKPVLGVVYAPALKRLFSGSGSGCFEQSDNQPTRQSISVRDVPSTGVLAVASKSHRDEATDNWLEENNIRDTISTGSSLKFCLIAAGEADVYPRFGPTMEWDTAAGHAVLVAAGGRVENPDGSEFCYGKPEYRNSAFIARGCF